MKNDQFKILKLKIVKEIDSTYSSIAAYKKQTSKPVNLSVTYQKTAARRLEIIEYKLKSLKIMLAKIDNDNFNQLTK
tara:strand:- start:98562 stop:98792 length:231 start_codon:yes stop_codon:yes gene_type:complete